MRRTTDIWPLLLLVAVFAAGCPWKRSGSSIQAERFRPQEFDYGGMHIVYAPSPRAALELRWVLPAGMDSPAPALLDAALLAAPELQMEARDHARHFGVRHRKGYDVVHLGTAREHLEPALQLVADLLDRPVPGDSARMCLQDQRDLVAESAWSAQGPELGAVLRRETGWAIRGREWTPVLPHEVAVDSLARAWDQFRSRGNMTLVVAGNVGYGELVDALFGRFDGLPEGGAPIFRAVVPATAPVSRVLTEPWGEENGYGKMGVVLQFRGPGPAALARMRAAQVGWRGRLADRFREQPELSQGMYWGQLEHVPGIWLAWEGYRLAPVAELVMSELRQLKAEGCSAAEERLVIGGAQDELWGYFQSNYARADHLAERVGQGKLADLVPEIEALDRLEIADVNDFLAEDWIAVTWLLIGDTEKIDSGPLLRF